MLKILSLGAGVQSTALLLMSIRGEVERFDCAIFADTGWEPAVVYEHLPWLTGEAAVEMFIGISAVEQRRISPDLSKRHHYPFVFVRMRSGGRSEKRPLSGPPWWVSTADPVAAGSSAMPFWTARAADR